MAKTSYMIAGLGFGDEGKGRMTDYLVRRFGLDKVVRYNGGPQAAHHVVSPEGVHHCFSQFGSGTLVPRVKTYLSQTMLIDPLKYEVENQALMVNNVDDALSRTFIDENCYIITPFHQLVNQIRELARGVNRFGSCGQGVGETARDVANFGSSLMPQAKDLSNLHLLWNKLTAIQEQKIAIAENIIKEVNLTPALEKRLTDLKEINVDWLMGEYAHFGEFINIVPYHVFLRAIAEGNAVFEGAQGALLDRHFGFYPHVTQSDTGFVHANNYLNDCDFTGKVKRLGVIRGYYTRHGAGPLVTHDPQLSELIPPCHNQTNDWQGDVRLGWFDLLMARYALNNLGQIDGLAVTNLDRMVGCPELKVAVGYSYREDELHSPLVRDWRVIQDLRLVESQSVWSVPHALSRCEPIYKSDQNWRIIDESGFKPDSPYLKYLAKELNVPIVMTAYGPTAKDTICQWC